MAGKDGWLGREDGWLGRSSSSSSLNPMSEEDIGDTGATVRLMGLNQQDRRLVNRWWDDQLQSCGEQNVLGILIGEESGTLTMGRRANLVELSDRFV